MVLGQTSLGMPVAIKVISRDNEDFGCQASGMAQTGRCWYAHVSGTKVVVWLILQMLHRAAVVINIVVWSV